MTQLDKIAKGISILQKYGADCLEPYRGDIAIYGAEISKLSDRDVKELLQLGFEQSDSYGIGVWVFFT